MTDIIKRIERFIESYVSEAVKASPNEKDNFDLKFEHTNRVRKNMILLSEKLNYDESENYICELIGLLHDIGRFKQYSLFKSFSDAETGSHATHSVEMIEEYDLLKGLNSEDIALIKLAIEYHNHFHVPNHVKGRLLKLSTLIRDADKLDAFFLETAENDERQYNLGKLSDERNYSDEVIADLMNLRQVDFSNFKYRYDRTLGILGLLFNLEYKESLEILNENHYIDRVIDSIPGSEVLEEIRRRAKAFVDKKISHH